MEPATYLLIGALGIAAGSFLNAYVWRTYNREERGSNPGNDAGEDDVPVTPPASLRIPNSVLRGRSQCPDCGHTLQARDLVPVVSWLWLRGKCRYCSRPISRQYPAVEITTAVLFVLSLWWWPFPLAGVAMWLRLVAWFGITGLIIALAVYDVRWYLLPDSILRPLLLLVLLHHGLAAAGGAPLQEWLIAPVWGGLGAFGFFYALYAIGRGRWMGGGDVKLVFVLGVLVGGVSTIVGLFIAFLSAATVGMALILSTHKSRRDMVPFGPFLLLGFWLAFFFGDHIAQWYTGFITG